jgi:dTDP-4-dehydrorhamnose reductase
VRVLVTGGTGLLGTWLRRTAPTEVHVTACARSAAPPVDLLEPAAAQRAVARSGAEAVIHAAYAVDRRSIVTMTANVAAAAAAARLPLIHISTEAVFSGDGRVRTEDEQPDPVWDYGRWKVESEAIAVRTGHAAVVRLPLLVSPDPADGNVRMLRAAAERGTTVGWYDGELRQPARARDAAEGVWRILQAGAPAGTTWHLPGPEVISRYELGVRLERALGVSGLSTTQPAPPTDARPRDLRLHCGRAERAIGWAPAAVP